MFSEQYLVECAGRLQQDNATPLHRYLDRPQMSSVVGCNGEFGMPLAASASQNGSDGTAIASAPCSASCSRNVADRRTFLVNSNVAIAMTHLHTTVPVHFLA